MAARVMQMTCWRSSKVAERSPQPDHGNGYAALLALPLPLPMLLLLLMLMLMPLLLPMLMLMLMLMHPPPSLALDSELAGVDTDQVMCRELASPSKYRSATWVMHTKQ